MRRCALRLSGDVHGPLWERALALSGMPIKYVEVSCRNNGNVAVLERTLLRALAELPPLDALREGAGKSRLRDRLRVGGGANDLFGLIEEMWGASGLGGVLGELSCIKRRGGDGREGTEPGEDEAPHRPADGGGDGS